MHEKGYKKKEGLGSYVKVKMSLKRLLQKDTLGRFVCLWELQCERGRRVVG